MEQGHSSPDAQPYWSSDAASPYGLADEDASLRQVDSRRWRSLFGAKRGKRFIPSKPSTADTPSPSSVNPLTPRAFNHAGRTRTERPLGTVVMVQFWVCALALTGLLLAVRSHSPISTAVARAVRVLDSHDFGSRVVPTLETIARQLHWTSLALSGTSHALAMMRAGLPL